MGLGFEYYSSLSPIPCSLFPIPYSLLPTPYSLLPTPYSLLPTPYSLLPTSAQKFFPISLLIVRLNQVNQLYRYHR